MIRMKAIHLCAAPTVEPEAEPQAALLSAPRRPECIQAFQRLSRALFFLALPTPPPQRVWKRGRQSFSVKVGHSKIQNQTQWGRRGAGGFGGSGDGEADQSKRKPRGGYWL